MKKWSWKAILGGCAVDIVGGIIIATAVITPFVVFQASQGTLAAPTRSLTVMLLTAVLGLGMDIMGGYCTAMWAPSRKTAHSAIMGVCSVLSGLLLSIGDQNLYPAWFQMTSILVIPAAMLGGWWRVKTHGPESLPKPEKVSSSSAPIASPFED
jgi:hypothetical protein